MKSQEFTHWLLSVLLMLPQITWSDEVMRHVPENFLSPEQYQFYQFYSELPEIVEVFLKPDSQGDTVRIPKKELVGSICSHFIKTVAALENGDYGEVNNEQTRMMTNHSFRLCEKRIPKIQSRIRQ